MPQKNLPPLSQASPAGELSIGNGWLFSARATSGLFLAFPPKGKIVPGRCSSSAAKGGRAACRPHNFSNANVWSSNLEPSGSVMA